MTEYHITKIVFHWVEASVPPPDHSEMEILVLPSGVTIKFWPDYPGEETPTWESTFRLNIHDWDLLLQMVLPLHDIEWITNSPPNLGGATEWIEIHEGEDKVVIPPDLIPEQVVKISLLYNQIRGLVPSATWVDLESRRKSYWQISGY